MTRIRGITPVKYDGAGYCTKCQLWGFRQLCKTYLSNQYYIVSYLHRYFVAGYPFFTRCYCLNDNQHFEKVKKI